MAEVPQSTVWYFRYLGESWMKLAAKQPWLSPDQVPHHHRAYFLWKLLPHYIDINSGATKACSEESHCFDVNNEYQHKHPPKLETGTFWGVNCITYCGFVCWLSVSLFIDHYCFKIQRQLWEQWIHGQSSGGREANTDNGTRCDAEVGLPLLELQLNLTMFWKGSTSGCFTSRGQTRRWALFSSNWGWSSIEGGVTKING